MKINYIKVRHRKKSSQFQVYINGYIEDERLIPIIEDDCFILKREPLIGDISSKRVVFNGGNSYTVGSSLPLDSMVGERLYPCKEESTEDEIIFWIK